MNIDKTLEEKSSEKNSVYYKVFDNPLLDRTITESNIIEKIKTVYDPEIPVNIYDLGLVYELKIADKNNILIKMTLTTPNCPVADSMPKQVGESLVNLDGISSIKVELVWNPPWNKDMMSEDAKLALDII